MTVSYLCMANGVDLCLLITPPVDEEKFRQNWADIHKFSYNYLMIILQSSYDHFMII